MTTKPAAVPVDWSARLATLAATAAAATAELEELQQARGVLAMGLAADGDARTSAALAEVERRETELKAVRRDTTAALELAKGQERALAADAAARHREELRAELGRLVEERATLAAGLDELLRHAETMARAVSEESLRAARLAAHLGLEPGPGFTGNALEASVRAAVLLAAPTLAELLGVERGWLQQTELRPLAWTLGHTGAGLRQRVAAAAHDRAA